MRTPTNFSELVDILVDLIRTAVPVIAGLALLVFFWGMAKFIFRAGGDTKAVEEGKTLMIWGLIALFVMVSVWGIISFIQNAFLPGGGSTPTSLPTSTGLPAVTEI